MTQVFYAMKDNRQKNKFLPNKEYVTSWMRMLWDAGLLTKIQDWPLKSGTPGNCDGASDQQGNWIVLYPH